VQDGINQYFVKFIPDKTMSASTIYPVVNKTPVDFEGIFLIEKYKKGANMTPRVVQDPATYSLAAAGPSLQPPAAAVPFSSSSSSVPAAAVPAASTVKATGGAGMPPPAAVATAAAASKIQINYIKYKELGPSTPDPITDISNLDYYARPENKGKTFFALINGANNTMYINGSGTNLAITNIDPTLINDENGNNDIILVFDSSKYTSINSNITTIISNPLQLIYPYPTNTEEKY
jgi:hypothetical protein